MITIKAKELKQLKAGEITVKDFAQKLIENFPVKAIAEAYAELLTTADNVVEMPKVPITKEMFEAHFRLIGYNADGTESTRGRKKKVVKEGE